MFIIISVLTILRTLHHCFSSIVHPIVVWYRGMYLSLIFDSLCCVVDITKYIIRLVIAPSLGVFVYSVENQMHNRYMDKSVPMHERNLSSDADHRYLVDRDTMPPKNKLSVLLLMCKLKKVRINDVR